MNRGHTFTLSFPPFTRWVKRLILIYAVVYFLQVALGSFAPSAEGYFEAFFGLVPAFVVDGWIWQLVTYSFLHGGLLHILFNALTLWTFGSALHSAWGSTQLRKSFTYGV